MTPETPSSSPSVPPPPPSEAQASAAVPPAAPAADYDGHTRLIRAVQRRQRQQLWLEGALWGTVALGLLALAGALLGARWPGVGRALLVLAPVAFAAVLVAFGVGVALRRVGDGGRTARLIGRRVPQLSLDVLSAVELERALGGSVAPAFSSDLARAFLASLSERTRTVAAEQVVDRRPLKHAAWGLAALLLVLLVAGLTAGTRLREGLVAALAPREGSAEGPQVHEPITGDVELVYHYPAYTGLQPRTVAGTRGDVSAPAGTEVRLTTRSDRPVERAEVVVNGQRLPLAVEGGRALSGRFVVEKAGSYHFAFQDRKGREVARGPDVPLAVEADRPPQVQVRRPGEELEVDPGESVELRYEASDDYGLSKLELVYRTPGATEEKRVALPRDDEKSYRGTFRWDVTQLGLQPGERVTYYVEARDNDAVAGPKPGVSRTQSIKLYSAAEKRRLALERAQALWERLVGHLADRLEGPERARTPDQARVAAQSAVDEKGLTLVTELREVAAELAQLRDAPPALSQALANVADSSGRRVQATSEFRKVYLRLVGRKSQLLGTDVSRRLGQLVTEEIATLEKDVLYLEALLDRQRLEELKELARELNSSKRELASLIQQYKDAPDEALRQQILHEVEALRADIQELMRRMSELAKGIRDEHLNAEALQELMQEGDMSSALDDLERLMREGNTEEALKKLQELSMQMEQMLESFDKADQELGEEQFPELAEKFQSFMDDLKATAEQQDALAQQTQDIRDRARNANRERLQGRGQAMKEQLEKQVKELERDYQQLRPEQLNGNALVPLEQVQEALESARNALQVDDFDLAAEATERAVEASRRLAAQGQQQRALDELYQNPPEVKQQSARLAEQLEQDARKVEDVNRRLQSLFPQPGSQLSQADRQKLEQLSREQRQLEKKAQGLGEQMEQMQQLAPVFDQQSLEQMGEVADRMGQAAERMEGKDANRGHGEQRAALEGLQDFQKQMQQQRSQGKGGRGGLPLPMGGGRQGSSGGRDSSREKVEIPDEEQFQAPREFRKDLLDAMKEGAPDRYREQVKRYYEELVK